MIHSIKVHSSSTSPFGRRVSLALKRIGHPFESIEAGNLFPPDDGLIAKNPLGLIPNLEFDKEDPICDSTHILEFLDHKLGGIWPKELQSHWKEKRVSIFATGVMTHAVSWRLESLQESPHISSQESKIASIKNTLKHLNQMVERDSKRFFHPKPGQGAWDIGIALEYLEFRLFPTNPLNFPEILKDLLENLREDRYFKESAPKSV